MSLARHLPAGCALRRATAEDARHVDRLMRPADRAEIEALEGRPVAEFLAEAIADRSRVLTIDREPVVLYGIAACDGLPGHSTPWHATTATIAHEDLMTVMWLSRLQIDLWHRHSPTLQALCDSRNFFRRDWLEWLGFIKGGHLAAFGAARLPFDLYVRRAGRIDCSCTCATPS
ncbi:MAG: hypothetical protein ACHP83_17365 [Burkholderiales bacterium]